MIKAVVFDMDGVLFDTERLSIDSIFQTAREMGLNTPAPAVYGLLGRNTVDGNAFFRKEMEKVYPGDNFPHEEFRARHRARYAAELEKNLPLKKGVKEILQFLKEKGVKLAVATSTEEPRVRGFLARHDMTGFFDAIITGDMVEHSKPQPDIYQKACAVLDVACDEAVAVEDSPNGICSAHAAGMFAVMVPDLVQPSEEMRRMSDLICEDMPALQKYLEGVLL